MSSVVRSPYRTRAAAPSEMEPSPADAPASDRELWPVLVAVWVASAIRVAGAIGMHQVFGAEATLALLTLLAVPAVVGHPLRACLERRRRRSRG
jgi:hypothetical protein